MTKILFFNILFIYSFPLFAQNYQAEYSEFGTFNHGHATLLFNKDAWFYDMFYQEEMEISSDDIYISDEEAEDKLDIRRFNYYSLDKKYFLWEESDISEKCVIKGDLDPLNWIIFNDSTKTIGGYHCMLAQCDLCGWNIKAWFTPEIPVGCGPWRLWGLPGLIVSAFSSDGEIDIQMTSMKQTAELPQEPDLKKRKVISKEVYRKRLEANAAKLARAFNSQQDSREASTSYEVKTNNTDKCLR